MARRALAAVAALAAAMPAAALFSTTLHGAPTEVVQPGTPGVATMQLQPWLTTIDPDVRPESLRSRGARAICACAALARPRNCCGGYAGGVRGSLVATSLGAAAWGTVAGFAVTSLTSVVLRLPNRLCAMTARPLVTTT